MSLPPTAVQSALEKLGVYPDLAATAAADARLDWNITTLQACVGFAQRHQGTAPAGAVLWERYLKAGRFPRAGRSVAATIASIVEETAACPVCHDDLASCKGMHGWAAQYRDMTPEEIFPG